jgi:hypothetical protein
VELTNPFRMLQVYFAIWSKYERMGILRHIWTRCMYILRILIVPPRKELVKHLRLFQVRVPLLRVPSKRLLFDVSYMLNPKDRAIFVKNLREYEETN